MARLWRIRSWPLSIKVPVLVAGLVIVVAAVVSQLVLSRLVHDQEQNLRQLSDAYLDGLSAAVQPAVVRNDVWETFDALDRARHQYAALKVRYAVVVLPDGLVLAASDPQRFPVQSEIPATLVSRFPERNALSVDTEGGRALLSRPLLEGGVPVGRILSEIDIADLLRVRHQVLMTLILVNGGLTIAFAAIGYFALKRMLNPLSILTRHVERIREGRVEPMPRTYRRRLSTEFAKLFDSFNAMATAVSEREALASRLAEQERYAMLGHLASGMAHEVNNPLSGMLVAIDTIQAHGNDPEAFNRSLEFLKRGLAGIRNVVRSALVTYKGGASTAILNSADLDDLPFLVQHETGTRRLHLEWRNRIQRPLQVDGLAVRQIVLNLLLNACAVSPVGSTVAVEMACDADMLRLTIADRGPGLPLESAAFLDQSALTDAPPSPGKGLGLWTTARLVHHLGGRIFVERPGVGTRIMVELPASGNQVIDDAA